MAPALADLTDQLVVGLKVKAGNKRMISTQITSSFTYALIRWMYRWSNDEIKAMLLEQHQAFWQRDTGIERTRLEELERCRLPYGLISWGVGQL